MNSMKQPDHTSLEDLKREAAATREKVQGDISAVVDKVSPARLKQDAKAALEKRGRRAAASIVNATSRLAVSARAHPWVACSALLLIGGAMYATRRAAVRRPRFAAPRRGPLLAVLAAAVVSWRLLAARLARH